MRNKANKYSPERVWDALDMGGMNTPNVECLMTKALALLPEEVVDFVAKNVAILSESDSGSGAYWSFEHFFLKKKKGFVLLNADLWKKSKEQIAFTVAHEVAHAYLGHNAATYEEVGEKISLENEIEADKQAIKWLSDEFDSKKLLKLASYLGKC